MMSPRERSPRRAGRRRAVWAAMLAGGLASAVGCQVEYAGMTLPSGKYMYDDVQYFPPGPDFRWANTHAATQRARMQAMGMDVSTMPIPGAPGAPVTSPPPAEGALDPTQQRPGAPTNVNTLLIPPGGNVVAPPEAPPSAVPPPGFQPPAPGTEPAPGGPDQPGAMPPPGPGGGTVPPPGVDGF